MADSEFEEFRHTFKRLPQHTKVPAPFYSLVHDVQLDEEDYSPTSSVGSDGPIAQCQLLLNNCDNQNISPISDHKATTTTITTTTSNSASSCTTGNILSVDFGRSMEKTSVARVPMVMPLSGIGERKRRKLPEIPNNKKPLVCLLHHSNGHQHQINNSTVVASHYQQQQSNPTTRDLSLAEELTSATSMCNPNIPGATVGPSSLLVLKCGYLWDDNDSPDSERLLTDADSGHSTAHSPTDGAKSMSPVLGMSASIMCTSSISKSVGGVPFPDADTLEGTHRGLHKFIPRHEDEIEVEIGDPIYVQKESDDLWCEGVNLRTGRLGIFPSAYAVDSDLSDWDSTTEHGRRERYLLGYLGSVETWAHKGTSVVCQAVRRVVGNNACASGNETQPHPCILEVSDQGLRMVDRRKRNANDPCIDYFYSLKNVSFCAFHPRDHRYLGFITKHPTLQRFACHVFRGSDSTRPVAEGVGRAFQRFYQKFIETAYPIEDIYIE